MAFGTSSGVFTQTIQLMATNAVAYNWGTDTLKCALFNNSATPDKNAVAASMRYNTGTWLQATGANEVYHTGHWPQGGVAITAPTVTAGTNVVTLSTSSNTVSTDASAVLQNVYGVLVYDDTVTNKDGISFHSFGGSAVGTNPGTFTVVWNSQGIVRITN